LRKGIDYIMKSEKRRIGSIKSELVKKSKEAAMSEIQIFNNPLISFKSELFIVSMIIAWTYLLHAYYRDKGIDYRYCRSSVGKRKIYDKTASGDFRYWDLSKCLSENTCPLDKNVANNLKFLIGIRNEIEHKMTSRIDDLLSARLRACALNYNSCIKKLFGGDYGIDKHLSVSIQLSGISLEQKDMLDQYDLPSGIRSYIRGFDANLSEEEFSSPSFAYRVFLIPKTANRKNQADKMVQIIDKDSPMAEAVNKEFVLIKDAEKSKHLPKRIVETMKNEGFIGFSMHHHTTLWKSKDAKNPSKGFGVKVENTWYWYDSWLNVVREHCNSRPELREVKKK